MYIKFYIDFAIMGLPITLGTMRGWKNMGKMLRYISAVDVTDCEKKKKSKSPMVHKVSSSLDLCIIKSGLMNHKVSIIVFLPMDAEPTTHCTL